ncbi:MAG TPA: hypothetical protein VLJ37_04340 [bacterium]|nr:hypothetical protein [bacterium]
MISASAMTRMGLSSLSVPAGLSLVPGGSRAQPLELAECPRTILASRNPSAILDMLRFAGVRYQHPDSPAAAFGVRVFETGRELARHGPYDAITFDWDHTLGNYQIFENVAKLIRVRSRREEPPPELAATAMVAIEVARPFMHELAFGTMAGFALRQGLQSLDEWENYKPQVALSTHTWPDRLGILATYFMPLLPLMEGLLPGSPRMYAKMTDPGVRSVIHLHHFLGYAEGLIRTFNARGFDLLTAAQCDEVMAYLEDGKAHYRKPLGALAMRGWETSSLLHFDDSTTVIADLMKAAGRSGAGRLKGIHVRHPHSNVFRNVQEWHKIALPALWRRRENAIRGVVTNLARMEWKNSDLPAVLGALGVYPGEGEVPWPKAGLPEGVVLAVHETPTTLGEFWRYYVQPTNHLKELIRNARRNRGGLRAIRRAYREAVEARALPSVSP